MKAVVIAFFATNALLLAGTAVFGAMVSAEHYFIEHFALGLATTLFACLCHCVVFTYFMATGKMIVLAVEDASLDPELALEASRLKMRAFRMIMPAILLALAAAISGGWTSFNRTQATLHLTVALGSSLMQLTTLWVVYGAVTGNAGLMDKVFDQHHQVKQRSDEGNQMKVDSIPSIPGDS